MDGKNFVLIKYNIYLCYLNTKLWFSKFTEMDVCGRPLFANPVTYVVLAWQEPLAHIQYMYHGLSFVLLYYVKIILSITIGLVEFCQNFIHMYIVYCQ